MAHRYNVFTYICISLNSQRKAIEKSFDFDRMNLPQQSYAKEKLYTSSLTVPLSKSNRKNKIYLDFIISNAL